MLKSLLYFNAVSFGLSITPLLLLGHRVRRGHWLWSLAYLALLSYASHFILQAGGIFTDQGLAIYDALKGNPNLFLMLTGHVGVGEARRQDTFNGNTVHSLMSNYQEEMNGGNGWLRIMTFSPTNDEIQVTTYSPWLDQFNTDSDNQFTSRHF